MDRVTKPVRARSAKWPARRVRERCGPRVPGARRRGSREPSSGLARPAYPAPNWNQTVQHRLRDVGLGTRECVAARAAGYSGERTEAQGRRQRESGSVTLPHVDFLARRAQEKGCARTWSLAGEEAGLSGSARNSCSLRSRTRPGWNGVNPRGASCARQAEYASRSSETMGDRDESSPALRKLPAGTTASWMRGFLR